MPTPPRRPLVITSLLLFALLAAPAPALVNGTAPAEDDTTYDAVAALSRTAWFTAGDDDQHEHNWYGAAVLIAPDVILTAKHLLPPTPGGRERPGVLSVRFRRHADGTLGSTEQSADTFHQARIVRWVVSDRFDLALGILDHRVEHIEPVALALDAQPFERRAAVLAGWGSVSHWQGLARPRVELRVGENTVTAQNNFLRVDSYRTEPREDARGNRKNYIIDEHAVINMHDSGGSMFLKDEDGSVALAGIIATYSGGSWLPTAAESGFPLEAATQGAAALIEAVEDE